MNTSDLLAWARSADACAKAIVWLAARDQSEPAEDAIRAARLDWREWAAGRQSAPPAVLAVLATDPSERVRFYTARNPSTPPAVLERLATDASEWVRRYAARNPSTPPAVLERLATDASEWVRFYTARNPNTPKAKVAP